MVTVVVQIWRYTKYGPDRISKILLPFSKNQTLPFHRLHKMTDPKQANSDVPELIQKVNRQHLIPRQTPPSEAWLADTKA